MESTHMHNCSAANIFKNKLCCISILVYMYTTLYMLCRHLIFLVVVWSDTKFICSKYGTSNGSHSSKMYWITPANNSIFIFMLYIHFHILLNLRSSGAMLYCPVSIWCHISSISFMGAVVTLVTGKVSSNQESHAQQCKKDYSKNSC